MAAAIAHEVNNPLEGLVNLIYLARGEEDMQKIRRHLTEADRELQRIAHITRQSLGFYRETSMAGNFRPDVVTREVFEFYSARAAASRVSLHVNIKTEQKAFGNQGELRQVLSNLLNNAAKYTEPGGKISLIATRDNQDVCIRVKDNGVGIPEEMLPRIFERFFGADPSRTRVEGSGLGLAIAKHIVLAHDGTIRAESELNHGSVFLFTLPLATDSSPASA